ncbi:hypothetical protein KUTeg_018865 [Tegillarca granosa]|uniref:VWFC domain-containing protein n=1 Tax=Tegillarca granosa TaxID=220873 RepID=A0ABQ9EAU7_TEGGR|nr:hypothetical protein KUTeg_018865 [Tegillarca granosa]
MFCIKVNLIFDCQELNKSLVFIVYTLTYRCNAYIGKLAAGCTLVADPKDPQCCQVPQCRLIPPGQKPTPGIFTMPTPMVGSVTVYPNLPPQCILVKDKYNPCCNVPYCDLQNNTPLMPNNVPTQYQIVTPTTPQNLFVIPVTGPTVTGEITYQNITVDVTVFKNGKGTTGTGEITYPNITGPTVTGEITYQNITGMFDSRCHCLYKVTGPTVTGEITYLNITVDVTVFKNGKGTTVTGEITYPNITGFCVYNGVYYKQGQMWDDGCKRRCQCMDVATGRYSCSQRCPSFESLPNNCKLVTDQNDPCCLVPDCNTYPTHAPTPKGYTGSTNPLPIVVPTPIQTSFTGGSNVQINPLYPNSNTFNGTGGTYVARNLIKLRNYIKWYPLFVFQMFAYTKTRCTNRTRNGLMVVTTIVCVLMLSEGNINVIIGKV